MVPKENKILPLTSRHRNLRGIQIECPNPLQENKEIEMRQLDNMFTCYMFMQTDIKELECILKSLVYYILN